MTLWLGQDGFDYAFQADYARLWADEIDGIREVAVHDPDCLISIEYKPNEPRSYSLMPDCATTLLALREVGLPNLGVTLDFAHVLYADEQPAFVAALIARHSRILGVHLNDGYGKRDDGLMVGAVHSIQTIELLAADQSRRFRRTDLFRHLSRPHGPRSGQGMRSQHRDRQGDAARRRASSTVTTGSARRSPSRTPSNPSPSFAHAMFGTIAGRSARPSVKPRS